MNRVPEKELWSFEKPVKGLNKSALRMLATDYEKQTHDNDPVLYPGLMPEE